MPAKLVVPSTVKYFSAVVAPTVLPNAALPWIVNPSVPAVVPSIVLLKIAVFAVSSVSAVSVASPCTSKVLMVFVLIKPPKLTPDAVSDTFPKELKF